MWEGHITPYLTYEFNNLFSIRGELDIKRFDFRNELQSVLDIDRLVESGYKGALLLSVDSRDARVMPQRGLYFFGRVGYGLGIKNKLRYTRPEAADVLDFSLGDDFFEGEIFLTQTIPVSKRVWWTFAGDIYYKSSPSILDNYTIGGTSLEGLRNLPFMGYSEHEMRTDQHFYMRSDLRVGVFSNVSVAFVANLLVGESKSFNYSDQERDNTFTAFGIGFQFGILLPIGPVLFDIGYNSETQNVGTDLSIGWKHFF
jgi:hypothetical protein